MSTESLSFSNTLSKGSVYESFSMLNAYLEDEASRIADEKPEAISNEQIQKDDIVLETYRVEADAIHGGMGSVWRVHHLGWNTDLAMKRPQPRFFAEGSERRKEEFIAECEHWINLGLHPNIVSCYYVREIGGVPTIFSEWMAGGSLKDAIQSCRLYEGTEREAQARILDIAIQTARGLGYSHEQGLIHQDVKPGNILLTGSWDAKVADFGLAKARSRLTDGEQAISTGYTPEYCPREQAEGAAAEPWMDVYAWALTVLEMYAGKRLWETGAEAAKLFLNKGILRVNLHVTPPQALLAELERCIGGRVDRFNDMEALLVRCYREVALRPYPRPDLSGEETTESLNNRALSFLDLGRRQDALDMLERSQGEVAYYNETLLRRRMGESTGETQKRIRSKLKCLINLENKDIRTAWTELSEPIFDANIDHMMGDSDLGHYYEVIKSRLTQPPEPLIREFKGTAGYLFDGKLLLGVSSDEKPGKLPPENPKSMKLTLVDIDTGKTLLNFAPPPLYPYGRPFSHVGKICMSCHGKYAFAVNMNMQPNLQGRSFSTPMARERYLANEPCYERDVWNRAMGVHVWDGKTGEYLKYLAGSCGYDGLQGLWCDPEDEEIVRVYEHEWNVQTGAHKSIPRGKTRIAAYELPGGYTAEVTELGDASEVVLCLNGEEISRYGGGQISVDTQKGVILDAPYPISHHKYRSLWNYEHQVTLFAVRDFDFKAPMVLEKMHTTDELIKAYEQMQAAEESASKAAGFLDAGNFSKALQEYEKARYVCYSQNLWQKHLGQLCIELGWRFAGSAVPTFAFAVEAGRVDGPFKQRVSLAYDTEVEVGDSAYTLVSDPHHSEPIPIMPMDAPYTPAAFKLSIRSLSTGQKRELALPKGVVHAAIIVGAELYCLTADTVMREVVGPANRIYNWTIGSKMSILPEAWSDATNPKGIPGSEIRHVRWPIATDMGLFRVSLQDGTAERIGWGTDSSIVISGEFAFVAGGRRNSDGAPQSVGINEKGSVWNRKGNEVISVSSDAHLLVCGNRCAPGEIFLLNYYWKDPAGKPLAELVPTLKNYHGYEQNVKYLGMNQMTVIEPDAPAKPREDQVMPEPPREKAEQVKQTPVSSEKMPKKGLFARLFGRKG